MLLNEFWFISGVNKRVYQLYWWLFRICAAHIAHEANIEYIFSVAGMLSDPAQDPAYLTALVAVNADKRSYKPHTAAILANNKQQFRLQYLLEV